MNPFNLNLQHQLNTLYLQEMAKLLHSRQSYPLHSYTPTFEDQLVVSMIEHLVKGCEGRWGNIRCTSGFLLGKPETRSKEMRIAQHHESGRILVRQISHDWRLSFDAGHNPTGKKIYLATHDMIRRFGLEQLQTKLGYRNLFVQGPLREPYVSAALFPDVLRGI